ncbi:MAG: DUF2867 domain-containing protein [Candidatus Heimdallarchaeota archaeon]|nr:DUF2867 domain-containing protein [Candidatus Heimdallarchaeota archaeon]
MKNILVLGASGYIGSRLVGQLLQEGYKVRAGSRNKEKLKQRVWHRHQRVELISVNVFDKASLHEAINTMDVIYYLVHSMNPDTQDYHSADVEAAKNVREVAETHGINLMIYLGGLGDDQEHLSHHLHSRNIVGNILQNGRVPVTILRAAIVIGSSSSSFEILRYLVDRLPIMTTPKWVHTRNQPISVRNVLNYLVGCLTIPETHGRSFDIGGPDIITYSQLMQIYAKEAGLRKRLIIPVPVLSPKFSSYWVDFITPINKEIARPLVEGLRSEVLVGDDEITRLIPQELEPIDIAIRRALGSYHFAAFPDAYITDGSKNYIEIRSPGDPDWGGGKVYRDHREVILEGSRDTIWDVISSIGGSNGWYYGNGLWKLRGLLDEILGGPGLRRGRADQKKLKKGDYLDWWRVLRYDSHHLILKAEMKNPGYSLLKFTIKDLPNNKIKLIQEGVFIPRGLGGIIYWKFMDPLHNSVFDGMLKGIARKAKARIVYGPKLIRSAR